MEKKAQELYPNNKTFCGGVAQVAREAFIKGARLQKESDTLHWQDIKTIVEIARELLPTGDINQALSELQSEESYYTEILKRYGERRA